MYVGQKIVCIDDKNQHDFQAQCPCVTEGETYSIRGFRPGTGGIYLVEIKLEDVVPGIERGFLRSRFREIDMRFGEEVLEIIVQIIEEEELETVSQVIN